MSNTQTLPPFPQERWFAEFEFRPGIRHVSSSGAYTMTNAEILALESGAEEAFRDIEQEYSENQGSADLRVQVAARYPGLGPEDIVITHGAAEAILLFALATFRPGRAIVLEEPMYGSYQALARWLGATVRPLALEPSAGWRVDLERLEAALAGEQVDWVVLNPFHNPTGSARDEALLVQAGALAERFGARLATDDVFLPVAFDGPPPRSSASLFASAVSVGDVSKPWGLGGLRVGWLATRDHDLLETCVGLRHYSTISSARNSEWLGALALRHADDLLSPRLERARVNRRHLEAIVASHSDLLACTRVSGGYSAFLRLMGTISGHSAEPLCRDLVDGQGLLLLPGGVMGHAWREYVRVGLCSDPNDFDEVLAALCGRLAG
jgi:aspartate/methionine/tyrosine aminotransferase